MKNIFNNVILISIVLLITIAVFLFLQFRTANVILEYDDQFTINEQLSGEISISIEPEDEVLGSTPMIISLTKGNDVYNVETLTLEEFVSLSGQEPKTISKNGKIYYNGAITYSLDVNSIIEHTFTEPGNYELIFSFPKLDILVRNNIKVV